MAKIFISWSGETSHKIALILRDWLPSVIHETDIWVSSADIAKGQRWGIELSKQLEQTSFGIICIDPTNVNSPWLNFEAGAISKSIEYGRVFPLLFGIHPANLTGPLSQFQATTFEKDDFYRLVQTLSQTIGTSRTPPERLHGTFEIVWRALVNAINEIEIVSQKAETPESENKLLQLPHRREAKFQSSVSSSDNQVVPIGSSQQSMGQSEGNEKHNLISLKRVIQKYQSLISDDKLFFLTNIPPERISNAHITYANLALIRNETPLCLYDDTTFSSGKAGCLITDVAVYIKNDVESSKHIITLKDIKTVKTKGFGPWKYLLINDTINIQWTLGSDKSLKLIASMIIEISREAGAQISL